MLAGQETSSRIFRSATLLEIAVPTKAQYAANPEKYKARMNAYRLAHPEWHRASTTAWAAKQRAEDPSFVEKGRIANNKSRKKNQAKRQKSTSDWIATKPNYYIWKNAEYRAKKLGIPFSIKREDVVVPEFCPVLGIPLFPSKERRMLNPNSPSVDRIIPALGYVKGNVAVISMRANMLKRDATADELERVAAWVRRETDRIRKELG